MPLVEEFAWAYYVYVQSAQEWSWHTLTGYKFKYFSKRQIFFVLCYENL